MGFEISPSYDRTNWCVRSETAHKMRRAHRGLLLSAAHEEALFGLTLVRALLGRFGKVKLWKLRRHFARHIVNVQ